MRAADLMHAEPHSIQDLAGWIGVEKYDGYRALWDGYGLFGREDVYFDPPAWFVRGLPDMPLDCELFAGYGKRIKLLSGIQRTANPERWRVLKLIVFDAPKVRGPYFERLAALEGKLEGCQYAELIKPRILPSTEAARKWAREIVVRGGEGLVAYHPAKQYRAGKQIHVVTIKSESNQKDCYPGRGERFG